MRPRQNLFEEANITVLVSEGDIFREEKGRKTEPEQMMIIIVQIHPIHFRDLKLQFLNYFHCLLRSRSDSTLERIQITVTYKGLR